MSILARTEGHRIVKVLGTAATGLEVLNAVPTAQSLSTPEVGRMLDSLFERAEQNGWVEEVILLQKHLQLEEALLSSEQNSAINQQYLDPNASFIDSEIARPAQPTLREQYNKSLMELVRKFSYNPGFRELLLDMKSSFGKENEELNQILSRKSAFEELSTTVTNLTKVVVDRTLSTEPLPSISKLAPKQLERLHGAPGKPKDLEAGASRTSGGEARRQLLALLEERQIQDQSHL